MVYYVISIFKKGVKPHLFTWLIWALVAGIAAYGQHIDGAGTGAYVLAWVAISCSIRAVLALFYGEKNITHSDTLALMTCLFAIIIWQITQTPFYAIILVTLIDVMASYPTIRKSYLKPHEENMFSFAIMSFMTCLSLFALEHHSLITMLYPTTISILGVFFVVFLCVRRKQLGYKIIA